MSATIDLKDLTPAQRKALNLKAPRRPRSMSANEVRTAAIRVLHVVADLTPSERARVLRQASKLNDI